MTALSVILLAILSCKKRLFIWLFSLSYSSVGLWLMESSSRVECRPTAASNCIYDTDRWKNWEASVHNQGRRNDFWVGGAQVTLSIFGGAQSTFSWVFAGRKRSFRRIFQKLGGLKPPQPPRFRRLCPQWPICLQFDDTSTLCWSGRLLSIRYLSQPDARTGESPVETRVCFMLVVWSDLYLPSDSIFHCQIKSVNHIVKRTCCFLFAFYLIHHHHHCASISFHFKLLRERRHNARSRNNAATFDTHYQMGHRAR